MYLGGSVIDRTRRHVPKDAPTTEIITYTLRDDNNWKFYVNGYALAATMTSDIRKQVCVPVYVKPYQKNKELAYNLCIQKKVGARGEHF